MIITATTDRSNIITNVPVKVNIPIWNIRELYKTDEGYCFLIMGDQNTHFYVDERTGKLSEEWIENSEFHLSCNV